MGCGTLRSSCITTISVGFGAMKQSNLIFSVTVRVRLFYSIFLLRGSVDDGASLTLVKGKIHTKATSNKQQAISDR
jgi:hypothetical protein